jgi:hypothetical protein
VSTQWYPTFTQPLPTARQRGRARKVQASTLLVAKNFVGVARGTLLVPPWDRHAIAPHTTSACCNARVRKRAAVHRTKQPRHTPLAPSEGSVGVDLSSRTPLTVHGRMCPWAINASVNGPSTAGAGPVPAVVR